MARPKKIVWKDDSLYFTDFLRPKDICTFSSEHISQTCHNININMFVVMNVCLFEMKLGMGEKNLRSSSSRSIHESEYMKLYYSVSFAMSSKYKTKFSHSTVNWIIFKSHQSRILPISFSSSSSLSFRYSFRG